MYSSAVAPIPDAPDLRAARPPASSDLPDGGPR